ncbi:MAG TPA: DEAD/DEAH box helicase [Planctomycetota bacterium]|nr:DEAD/DEAH box helicase [Planctomycetota bacterium]HRR79263.1 DEAD/DEAH box helicase [Planctomycetota bacterium]
MDFDAFLDQLRASAGYRGQIVHVHRVAARAARCAEPSEPLSPACKRMLAGMGIERLYSHQAQALDLARAGRDFLVTTSTASGKTLCYLLPIVEQLERNPDARILALYPTKALSQDQLRVFERALRHANLPPANLPRALSPREVTVGVIDGDTPAAQRRQLRDKASVILTNPDMLHAGILPQHPRWAGLFSHLTHVVVDELHTYTGLFGAHVANLFRRLGRVCAHYGSRPQFLACSATLANPLEVAGRLLGRPAELVAQDGSPAGPRTYVLWNPPVIRSTPWRSRRSANVEAQELMTALVLAGTPTIAFSKAKVTAELIYRYVRESLERLASPLADKVTPYRAGYLAAERREIEHKLFSGELLGVSSTRALELGIDVGSLEASLIVGYPGTLASFFQQAGRAGRRDKPALVILVGLDTAINQYVMRHPDYLFGRPIEEGVLEPGNPHIVVSHLRCATHELPLPDDEVGRFGPAAPIALEVLEGQKKVLHDQPHRVWHHSAPETPQHEVSLRAMDDRNVVVVDAATEKIIGEMPKLDAPVYVHPEAIYLHQGDTWFVEALDLDRSFARVRKVDVDYYTQPLGGTDVHHIDARLRERPFGTGTLCFGEVTTHFHTWGYERIHFYTLDALSRHPLDLPTFVFETHAFWLVPPEELCRRALAQDIDPHAGCRGIGYATRQVLPLFVRCETLDFSHTVGAVNAPWNTMFVYERYPLGLGFTERAYELAGRLMPAVLDHIRRCDCDDGCPCCVGKPLRQDATWNVERGEGSIPSKRAALFMLENLLGDFTLLCEPDSSFVPEHRTPDTEHLRLALQRRLEHAREPLLPHPVHPIEHNIQTGFPQPEERGALSNADVARRVFRMLRHEKAIARGQRKPTPSTPEPQIPPAFRSGRRAGPTGQASRTSLTDQTSPTSPIGPGPVPIKAGDPLAALARRRKKPGLDKKPGDQ